MMFPTPFPSVTRPEMKVGNRARPNVAVSCYPLLCAPFRAQRWVTGNAMGAFPTLRYRKQAGQRGIGTSGRNEARLRAGTSRAIKHSLFFGTGFFGGHRGEVPECP